MSGARAPGRAAGLGPRLLLAAAALVPGYALAEAGLRLYARTNPLLHAQLREWDPIVSSIVLVGTHAYRPAPHATFHYVTGAVSHMNAQGYRGPVVERRRLPGSLRVVLLGGSTTHGAGVDDHETIDAHLRPLLARRHPGRVVEVVNLGFDAYDSECDAERFEVDGAPLDPDVVVVHSGINDVAAARQPDGLHREPHAFEPALERLRSRARGVRPTAWELWKHWSYLARVPGLVRRSGAGPMAGPPVPPPGGTRRFARNLRRIADRAPAGAQIVFSTPPSSLRFPTPPPLRFRGGLVVDDATTQRYRDALAAEMRQVAADVAAEGRRAVYVSHDLPVGLFLDDCHLTSEGNRRVAETLAAAIDAR